MNSLVFLRFELDRAQAQVAECFGKMPASSTKGVETKSCHAIAHRQPTNLEPGAQRFETLRDKSAFGLLCHKV